MWFSRSNGPRITHDGDCLVARTSFWAVTWSLGSFSRRVAVDPQEKTIAVQHREFWFARSSRAFCFQDVIAIGYGYANQHARDVLSLSGERTDSTIEDRYTVGLKLRPAGEYVELFAFTGYGGQSYDFSIFGDWNWFGRNSWFVGDQAERSRQFAELLAGIIGRKVAPA
jgi:hypothetical protein